MDSFLTLLSGALGGISAFLVSWLPNDPFDSLIQDWGNFALASPVGLGWLNWFLPFGNTALALSVLITAVLVCAIARLTFMIVELIPGE